jgi:DNA-binding NtrC family response regulator
MTPSHGSLLLVDDEEKILKALGRALRDAGHEVVEATSAKQARKLLAERAFDVLVVDNVMPESSGLDLIRELVAEPPDTRDRGAGPPECEKTPARRS